MKHVITLITGATLTLLLFGCATTRKAAPVLEQVTEVHDSVRVEYVERVVLVPDTLFVDIPSQTAERETRDSVSTLENDFAVSVARLTADGRLFHSLNTKPQQLAAPFDKPVVERETKASHTAAKAEAAKRTETVYVAREYTWWDKTRFYGFYGAIIFFLITYSKQIFGAVVRVIQKKITNFVKRYPERD